MFLLAGKLARIRTDFFYNFSKFCFLLPGTAAIIHQRYQAFIHERNAIKQRDQARVQRLARLARLLEY